MHTDISAPRPIPLKPLMIALVANTLWINASEVFRYFAFVMPMMRSDMATIEDVAPMNLSVFMIWGLWDTILVCSATGMAWLFFDRFGPTLRNVLIIGTAIWLTVFVILWLGLWNMNLASTSVLGVALPLAWLEMLVAAAITRWAMLKPRRP